jgi:biopolymer transport protein ExbD
MSFTLGGKGGIVSEVNVVPLIDILLVLLVIFVIFPHEQMGLRAQLPQISEIDPGSFRNQSSLLFVRMVRSGSISWRSNGKN